MWELSCTTVAYEPSHLCKGLGALPAPVLPHDPAQLKFPRLVGSTDRRQKPKLGCSLLKHSLTDCGEHMDS